MIFSNDTSVFIPEYCVSDNPIRHKRPRTPTNDHEYYHDTTRNEPGRVAQSVTCLATDASLTADQGVASSILARSHTFVEIDHEIISTIILLPSAESFKKVVSYKRKYVHEVLVNCLLKLSQEKMWLSELTVPQ